MGMLVAEECTPGYQVVSTGGRLPQLDSLRGFLLVWMTLTHLPTVVSQYSNQMPGYVSAAEGFILLAAILVSRISRREEERSGIGTARKKLLQRAARIYRYHLVLLGVAFSLCAIAAVYQHRVPLQYLLDYYLQKPHLALAAAPLLLYNPPLLDILPMYIVFMLLTPLALGAAARSGWGPVLGVSAALWLLAQFNLRAALYSVMVRFGFPIPLNEMGAFDILAWQFLWIIGLALGRARLDTRFSRRVLTASAIVAGALFVCRHTTFDAFTGPALFDVLVDKWRLGIFRLFDSAALGVLLMRFGAPLANSAVGRRLELLGRASLEVFCAHAFFCFMFLAMGNGQDPHFAWWQDAAILILSFTGLFAVARYVDQRRRRIDENKTRKALALPFPIRAQ
jgi:hypothetical protein